jgi:hypothetical protein
MPKKGHTEVEEELGNGVKSKQSVARQLVEAETDGGKEDGEHGETYELNWLAANGVGRGNCDPISWNGTSTDEDEITDGTVV